MSDKKKANAPFVPPSILKKSTSSAYTLEEKVKLMEDRIEAYGLRLKELENDLELFYETEADSDYEPVYTPFTIAWMPNNPPRVTQRDREIALWRKRTRNDLYLYCDEEIKDL